MNLPLYNLPSNISRFNPETYLPKENLQFDNTIIVPSDGSIQEAIDSANSGDTILIEPGKYEEEIRIVNWELEDVENLTIRGMSDDPSETVIKGSILFYGIDVEMSHLTVKGFDADKEGDRNIAGVNIANCKGKLHNVVVTEGLDGIGIVLQVGADLELDKSLIHHNSEAGVWLRSYENVQISQTTFADNGKYGLWVPGTDIGYFTAYVNNSLFVGHERAAIVAGGEKTVVVNYSGFFDNGTRKVGRVREEGYILTRDPLFINREEGNYHLQKDSPAIDAGDPSVFDSDETYADLGVYYYEHTDNHPPTPGESETIVVNPGESIQEAIDKADSNDEVLVKLGTYTTDYSILMKKGVTLKSEENEGELPEIKLVDPVLYNEVFVLVGADESVVSGMKFTGGKVLLPWVENMLIENINVIKPDDIGRTPAITFYDSSKNKIRKSRIKSRARGITLGSGSDNQLEFNIFHIDSDFYNPFSSNYNYGMSNYGDNNSILNCTIYLDETPSSRFEPADRVVGIYNKSKNTLVKNTVISHAYFDGLYDYSIESTEPITVIYSDLEYPVNANVEFGEGSFSANPLFANPKEGDFRPRTGSPLIDAGDPESPRDEYDSRVEIGAVSYDPDNPPFPNRLFFPLIMVPERENSPEPNDPYWHYQWGYEALKSSAKDHGNAGKDEYFGWGIVDAEGVLKALDEISMQEIEKSGYPDRKNFITKPSDITPEIMASPQFLDTDESLIEEKALP